MPQPFKPTFKDLEKDIERHLDRFGTKGTIMGAEAVFGLNDSRRKVFDAYVAAGANDAITAWLTRHWNYIYGTNPYFDETIDRFCSEGAATRVSRLWRQVCAEQIENYRILTAHRDLKGINKSLPEAKQRVLDSMRAWQSCLDKLGAKDASRRLDEEIADFEADRRKPAGKPDKRKMDPGLFWEIIGTPTRAAENTRAQVAENTGGQLTENAQGQAEESTSTRVEAITDRLAAFSPTQIKVFDKLLWEAMQRLNHYDVWAIAYLLQDGCSDDAFEAFRAWVILQGPEASELALKDPAAFVSRFDVAGILDGSALLHAAAIAFDRRAGKALPMAKRPAVQVQGTAWSEEMVQASYPILAARIKAAKGHR